VSRVYASRTDATAFVSSVFEASPLGRTAVVPWLLGPARAGAWVCAMVELSGIGLGGGSASGVPAAASFDAEMRENEVAVTWPDGAHSVTQFTRSPPISAKDGSGEFAARNRAINLPSKHQEM